MKINLFVSMYYEKDEARRKELEKCFFNNLKAGFDEIVILVENKDIEYITMLLTTIPEINPTNVSFVNFLSRPIVQEYIDLGNHSIGSLNCMCNADIYVLPEDIVAIKELPWATKANMFVALSRWDETSAGTFILLDRPDTADFWCWKGQSVVKNANCPLGWPGVDNSIAYKFQEVGYKVINPSRSIKTRHLHLVKIYNYRDEGKPDGAVKGEQLCHPPYVMHPPIFSHEI